MFFRSKYRRKVIYGELKADIGKILRKLCNENLPERDVAYFYKFDDQLPLTPVLKVDKIKLREMDKEDATKTKKLIKK